jgi:predicted ABC-type transport system involved in lysophospholipase L1 biosynthesis ATPase subunit
MVTHDRGIAQRCDRQLQMDAGRLTDVTGHAQEVAR